MDYTNLLASATPDTFINIADTLLNDTELMAGAHTVFYIAEIEVYLTSTSHPDPFTHCHPEQQSIGKWYFHRAGKTLYRGGTFKGLDITFGAESVNNAPVHGGILIRSLIEGTRDGPIIEGPCKCVNRLLEVTNSGSIVDLVNKIGARDVWDTDSILHIRSTVDWRNVLLGRVYMSARVGLNASRHVNGTIYAEMPYRFVTQPSLIKKQRKSIYDGLVRYHGLTPEEARHLLKTRQ